jgi:hypothetical protein
MDGGHPIHVIATNDDGTHAALAEARRLANRTSRRVVILVPQFVSFVQAPATPVESLALTERYRHFADAAGVEAVVRVCVCSRVDDLFRWMLSKGSRIIVGGRRRRFWPTAEERLAQRLKTLGHEVVFAAA